VQPRKTARRIAGLFLAAFLLGGSYATPMVVAHSLGASALRVAVFLDDARREPSASYYLAVKFWNVWVRVEWVAPAAPRHSSSCT
jgi:hypothetical protein